MTGAALELFERAAAYTGTALAQVTPPALTARTPCAGWDLHRLLHHLDDSAAALLEAVELGEVGLPATQVCGPGCPVAGSIRARVRAVLGAWRGDWTAVVQVADRALPVEILATAGALEIAVHGWDVACTLGLEHPLPAGLAADLLTSASALVSAADRPARFAPPVDVPPDAPDDARLLALVGRR